MRRCYAIYRYVGMLLVLGLLAGACTSSGDDGGVANDDDQVAGPTRTLEAFIPIEPPHLVPYDGQHGGGFPVFDAILMRLLSDDDQNELFSYPLESWEVSDDGRTVTLAIRPDIEWSDGTPMTSADVMMSLTHYLDPGLTTWSSALGGPVVGQSAFADGEVDSISGLSAPDDHTVVVELEKPNGNLWLLQLSQTKVGVVLPAHVLGDVPHDELADHEYFQSFPVTNGPYKFVEWASGQHVELEWNDKWSLGEAGFERLFYKFAAADAQLAQLRTGELQIIDVSPADVDSVSSLDGIEVESEPNIGPSLWLLRYVEPLLDRRVRQAMAYAIDREGICEAAFNGFCTVPLTNVVAPSWAIPSGLTEYRYDPDRARELLDEAGWDPSTKLTFLNWLPPDDPGTTAIKLAQGNMADVGINWTIENVDVPTWNERAEEVPGSFHGGPDSTLPVLLDPSFWNPTSACDQRYPDGLNRSHYCNEELDELLNAGEAETDPDTRAEIYQDVLRLLNEEVPSIALRVAEHVIARDSRLQGVTARSAWPDLYWNIGEWSWEE